MTIYVDSLKGTEKHRWCKLMGTDIRELEDFAVDLGVSSRKLFLCREGPRFYALTERQREKALQRGARVMKERAG